MTSEMRQNKLTGQWVIYAPDRGNRPSDFATEHQRAQDDIPAYDESCPFCPGHEERLPGIITQVKDQLNAHWLTRVIPNKFPVLSNSNIPRRREEGIYIAMPGHGLHEVIIESPIHNKDIAYMTDEEVTAVIETYHERYQVLMTDHDNMTVIIFRNHGERAGTSLIHPHSQVVVTSIVPREIRWREEIAQRHYDTWGVNLMNEILDYEMTHRQRIIQENESFVAFVPFAAEVPFEIWIVPKRRQADFGAITELEKWHLARILRDSLNRLCLKLSDPDYNYIIRTAPQHKADEPHLHWYVQIRPRLITRAGFEIGTGIRVNPSIPEKDAAFLNEY